MLEKYKSKIAEALPAHVKIDKLVRVISSQISQNPELGLADQTSLMSAVMRCAQLGLEPGSALSKVHLIPRKNWKKNLNKTVLEVGVVIGYQGLIELARRSGEISEIYAETVHENDEYKVSYGLHRDLIHIPSRGDRGKITDAYAVARFKDGGIHFVSMSKFQLEEIRMRPKYPNKVWDTDYSEMAKKTAIRRLSKYLPLSSEKAEQFHVANNIDSKIEIDQPQDNNLLLEEVGIELPKEHREEKAKPNMIGQATAYVEKSIKAGANFKLIFGMDAHRVISLMKNDDDCVGVISDLKGAGF